MWLHLLVCAFLSLISFFIGHLLFKLKLRWCRVCGASLTCPALYPRGPSPPSLGRCATIDSEKGRRQMLYVTAPVDEGTVREGADVAPPLAHPPWCHRDACSVGPNGRGTHNSKPVQLRATQPGTLGVAISLTQSTPIRGYPSSGVMMVDLTFTDTNDDYDFGTLPVDIGLARSLGRILSGIPADTSQAVPLG